MRTLESLFLTGEALRCAAAADANADGKLDISDSVSTLSYLFLGGAEPEAPFPGCGPESLPEDRAIDCATAPEGCQ